MPVYDFRCEECKKRFTLTLTVNQRTRGNIKCPKCSSRKVEQQYASVYAVTSKKS
ncbi:MAG TPA: FmdB family zinc ribbon protein [Candidatus Polarisedimenticolia bacterium]|nr:FmdB family zinc ribbon protein [Candidatus Polarisedimenticolia bacterium]